MPTDAFEELTVLLTYTIAIGLFHALCVILLSSNQLPLHKRIYRTCFYVWVVILPVMIGAALSAVFQLSDTIEHRWQGTTPASYLFLRIYCALNILSTLQEFYEWYREGGTLLSKLPTLVHHFVSILVYSLCLVVYRERLHYFACLDGLCEFTTVHLTILQWSKLKNNAAAVWLQKHCNFIFLLNGCLLWLTYIVFRLMLFPYWGYTWYTDIFQLDSAFIEGIGIQVWLCPAVTFFLFVLSVMWFHKIHTGMMKALNSGATGLEEGDDNRHHGKVAKKE